MDEHPSPWIAAVVREEARKLMAEHERTHHGGAMEELREELRAAAGRTAGYACPNGHAVGALITVPCEQCAALVAYEPLARGLSHWRAGCACAEARLLGELWVRSSDELTRRLGADLLQVLDDQAS